MLQRELNIGKLKLQNALLLAPMEGYTDISFRGVCKELGADLVYTEFVSSEGLRRDVSRSSRKIIFREEERPVGIQIFGNDPQAMGEAARISSRLQPELLDLNFGCPVRKVAGKGSGAALMKTPDLLLEIAEAVIRSTDLPVTAKLRLGWDEDSINILEIAPELEKLGIAAITLHARTRAQKYSGNARWEWIRRLKDRVQVPVIGNGDVVTPQDALQMFAETGCDAVMIGRGATSYPWIFRDTRIFLNDGVVPPPPDLRERLELLLHHYRLSLTCKGEERGVWEMRHLHSRYLRDHPNACQVFYPPVRTTYHNG
nr:tRNA dihydrouridine synthase DusB [bacterium]